MLSPVINGFWQSYVSPASGSRGDGTGCRKQVNKMNFGDGWAVAERGRSCFISGSDSGPKSSGKGSSVKKKGKQKNHRMV